MSSYFVVLILWKFLNSVVVKKKFKRYYLWSRKAVRKQLLCSSVTSKISTSVEVKRKSKRYYFGSRKAVEKQSFCSSVTLKICNFMCSQNEVQKQLIIDLFMTAFRLHFSFIFLWSPSTEEDVWSRFAVRVFKVKTIEGLQNAYISTSYRLQNYYKMTTLRLPNSCGYILTSFWLHFYFIRIYEVILKSICSRKEVII